jgi:hypothetical protein
MQLKTIELNGVTYGELQDGKPLFVHDDGKTIAFDAPGTLATISRLNAEAKGHREEKEALATKMKAFEGIDDPAKALKALETVKNLDDKTLIDAGQVEKVKQEARAAFDEQLKAIEKTYEPIVAERDKYKSDFFNEVVGGAFSRSKFIADKLAIPGDLAQAKFGSNFLIEDGKVVGKNAAGERIFSRTRPGEIATFDEALESLIEDYPHRDTILKGIGASGGGAGGSTRMVGGKKTMLRSQFDALDPAAQMAAVKDTAIVD